MIAVKRPGPVAVAVLAGLLLALTSSVAPARGDTPTTGQIIGTIRDHGSPLAGATVEAVDPDAAWGPPYSTSAGVAKAVTDAAGHYRLTSIPPGTYLVRTTMPGGWMVQFYPASPYPIDTAVAITVTAGKTENVDDEVLPHASLSGQVTTNRGAPADGAYVNVPNIKYDIHTFADEQGRYLIDYLAAGEIQIRAARGLYAPADRPTGPTLVVDQRTNFDIRLSPVGEITGKYVGPQGPVYAAVVASADGQASVTAISSADDGSYALWVYPGSHKLFFNSINDHRDQWATGKMAEADAEVFTVREDGVIHHDEHTLPTGKVGGRVLDYTGAPLDTPTTVYFHSSDGYSAADQTTTDSAGYWSIDVAPGTYTVEFRGAHDELWANDRLTEDTADSIVVGPGTTTTLPDARYHTVTDLIVSATLDGTPVDSFCATLDTPDADQVCTDNGTAFFPGTVPVGTHQVTVVVPGHPPAVATVTLVNKVYDVVTVPVTG